MAEGYNGGVGILRDEAPGERLPRLVAGLVALPPSKSHTLRALMVAAAARRRVTLSYEGGDGWGVAGEDIQSGLECARALGSEVVVRGGECLLEPGIEEAIGGVLPVGESGFLGRVSPTCAALSRRGRWEIAASGSLKGRASAPLWSCLRGAGVDLEEGGGWLASVHGADELGVLTLTSPISSQELSALWIGVAARGGGDVFVEGDVPSEPYLDLTRSVLSSFGAAMEGTDGLYRVSGASRDPESELCIEVDASAAAVALAAGCLSGVRVEVPAPAKGSTQGDWRIVEHLRSFGCQVEELEGRLVAAGGPTRGACVDLAGEPDLAPVLTAVAAGAARFGAGESTLSGLHTLDGKESRRGQVLESGLRSAGFSCDWADPELRVGGEFASPGEVTLDSCGDHRMAFAFALLGVLLPEVSVGDGDCIAKSWPNFWSAMS